MAWINSIRYGKDGYIFVYDYQANTLAHYKPENIGLNQWDFRDANNKPVLQELISIAKEDKGQYLTYVGTIRPSTGLPEEKIAYARGIQDWQWMVGTGVYVRITSYNVCYTKLLRIVEGRFAGSTLFDLPSVPGAIIMKPEERPVLSTRTAGDKEYSVQRHEFSLFCQHGGEIAIPEIQVRCGAIKSFGLDPSEYSLHVPAFTIAPRIPKGAQPGQVSYNFV